MQSKQRIFYAVILALGLVWIFVSADRDGASTNGLIPAPRAGFLAPDFTLETMNGETVKLSDLRGQAVIVNLWATWCPPCKAEMPALQKVYEEYKSRGLVILAINSTVQDDAQAIPAFLAEYGLTFPVLLDVNNEAGRLYQLRSLPSTFFIRRDGTISEVVIGGPMAEALLRTRVEEILK